MNQNKKLSRRERDRQPPVAKAAPVQRVTKQEARGLTRFFSIAVTLFAFVLYIQTVSFDYTHDDFSVIKENTIVSQGSKAIPQILKTSYRQGYMAISDGLYRPLSLIMFAVEWSISPDSPGLHHFINVLLFAITALLLFQVLRLWLPRANILIPACIALLFVAHPVHTEVVASIKSRDEILCFMFSLLSLRVLMIYCTSHHLKDLIVSLICFFLALMSKETGVVLLVLIPVTLYYFTSLGIKRTIKTSVYFLAPIILYFIIRFRVLHSLPSGNPVSPVDNFLVAAPDYFTRLASCFNILGEYLKLLVFPYKLISDYSAGTVTLVGWTDVVAISSLVIHLALFIYALVRFNSKDPMVYGIIYYLVSIFLFSNILFVIGTPMGERLLYFPSLGFCMVLAIVLKKITSVKDEDQVDGKINSLVSQNKLFVLLTTIIIGLYTIKTMIRSRDWINNDALYAKDVITAPDDYRLHYYLGRELTRGSFGTGVDSLALRAQFKRGVEALQVANKLNPVFFDGYNQMGVAFTRMGEYKNAEMAYLESIKRNPRDVNTLNNLGSCYGIQDKLNEAEQLFKRSLEVDPTNYSTLINLANTYEYKGDQKNAQLYREKAAARSLSQ